MARTHLEIEGRRELTVLEAITRDEHITQRSLAAELGVALGLTNVYLKRLTREGYIECTSIQSNRLRYVITPQGIAEKRRLTYQFMEYSLRLYRDVRRHLSEVLDSCCDGAGRRVAVFGTGEAAELAYLSLKEQGLEPVAIFAIRGGGTFLGMPVRGLEEHSQISFDRLVVATLDTPDVVIELLTKAGISQEKLRTLKPSGQAPGGMDPPTRMPAAPGTPGERDEDCAPPDQSDRR